MNVLIIDDDRAQRQHLAAAVDRCGMTCEVAADGQAGVSRLLSGEFDVAFVDIELPKVDGKDILHRARAKGVRTYLVVLSSHTSEAEKLSCFSMGADDFLSKPVSIDELAMRLKAIARRLVPAEEAEILRGNGVTVNVETMEVRRYGRVIRLTPRESKLLVLLMRNRGRPISLETIIEHVWGDGIDPDSTVAQANISRLRKKLRLGDESDVIHTVRDVGYVFR